MSLRPSAMRERLWFNTFMRSEPVNLALLAVMESYVCYATEVSMTAEREDKRPHSTISMAFARSEEDGQ